MLEAFENGHFDIILFLKQSGHSGHVGNCMMNVASILRLIDVE
jgi:hypothetical protein